jgi:hypothetical protein
VTAAYDLDGVLAVGPPVSETKWAKMLGAERRAREAELVRWYRQAPVLFDPPERQFYVITARRDNPLVRGATLTWMERTFAERVLGVHLLNVSRTIDHVVTFKADALAQRGCKEFTEDNATVLKGLAKDARLKGVQLWWYTDGRRIPLAR